MKMFAPATATTSTGTPVFLTTESSTTVSNAEAKTNKAFEKLSSKSKQTVYIRVVNAMFIALERVNANLNFSREHLKYLLALLQ